VSSDRSERPGASAAEAAAQRCYSTWGETYYREYYGPDAVYPPVHLQLVRSVVDAAAPKRVLDAGCGPASMLRHLVAPGRELYGFDLTPEMIAEARRVMADFHVPAHRLWEGSVLDARAFACPSETKRPYDAAICVGVFPHITEEQESAAIANMHDCLRPGGLVAVEARNELFAFFTLNRYSHELFLQRLVPVAQLRAAAGAETAGLETALEALAGMFRTDLPPLRKGKQDEPGYDEVVSRVHNPLVFGRKFAAAGFTDVRTLFYHFHCLPPMLAHHAPTLFREQSLAMEADPSDWRGHFMASAFLVVGTRS
jgi:SAM-dependent methyltransferase